MPASGSCRGVLGAAVVDTLDAEGCLVPLAETGLGDAPILGGAVAPEEQEARRLAGIEGGEELFDGTTVGNGHGARSGVSMPAWRRHVIP